MAVSIVPLFGPVAAPINAQTTLYTATERVLIPPRWLYVVNTDTDHAPFNISLVRDGDAFATGNRFGRGEIIPGHKGAAFTSALCMEQDDSIVILLGAGTTFNVAATGVTGIF